MVNAHEELGRLSRLKKATALADTLQAAHINADLAGELDQADWDEVARAAKQNPPSLACWNLVVELLRKRETT